MKKIFYLGILLLLSGCFDHSGKNLVSLVNPFIGTDGHGHTFPGASIPFGMVQLSPDTRKDNWDACSGYHYSDTSIIGFSHTHLSGTGVGDYGDIRFMPMSGDLKIRPGSPEEPGSGYRSGFSHESEEASPGYYQVFLQDYSIGVELTATARSGFHRHTFPESDQSHILIDLTESVVTERNPELFVEIINDHEICGYRKSSGWAEKQAVYFYATFSEPFHASGIYSSGLLIEGDNKKQGDDIQAFVTYKTKAREIIMVKVGISAVSIAGAKLNLGNEIDHWKFDRIKAQAENLWEKELGLVEIKGGEPDDQVKFYTALYHSFLAPNLFTDSDGKYRGNDGHIHESGDFEVYTVFSLWDTYRALHPLLTILQPERTSDFIRTFIDIREKRDLLPVWELAGNETFCMIGYHAVPVIVDTYLKGIRNFDAEKAYEAIRNSAEKDHFGLEYYKQYGYIPAEKEGEAVSKTLEYAYDDWCIAVMAKSLGKDDDYRYFMQRAQNYKNLFDPETSFIRGKRNGMFVRPFDPTEVNFMLTEANTWQYTFYVPQDITGLKELMGGDSLFEAKLDEMFTSAVELSGRQQADITGLIGQYAHGNEPSHHMAYLYNYIGKAYKTQKIARQIMNDLYGPGPDGLCGNEDCGQMSAWFVLSAMGFYPVTPCSGIYAIGSPLFEEVRIHLDGKKDFVIRANGNNVNNQYISSARLNGEMHDKSFLNHTDLVNGGELVFEMTSEPNLSWASDPGESPVSSITEHVILPVPFFSAASDSFQDEVTVSIRHVNPDAAIYYTTGEIQPDLNSTLFNEPFRVGQAIDIKAVAFLDKLDASKVAEASFFKINNDWKATVKNPYNPQYTGGGDIALIDGQRGGPNFRTGNWQGYQGTDFEAIIDMGKNQNITRVSASFLQDQRSWIFMPLEVIIELSKKPYDFRTVAILKSEVPERTEEAVIKEFTKEGLKENGRYVRIIAKNRGTCPDWHPGAGDKAWIFTDEITIE